MEFKGHTKSTQDRHISGLLGGSLVLRTQAEVRGSRQNSLNPSHPVQGLSLLPALPQHGDMAPKSTLQGGGNYSGKSRKNCMQGGAQLVGNSSLTGHQLMAWIPEFLRKHSPRHMTLNKIAPHRKQNNSR